MIELNEANFSEETKNGLVLVDFFTSTCPPCRMLAPILEQVENIKVVKVNAADNQDLAVQFGISAVPTLVYLRDGVEIHRSMGFQKREALQAKINELL